MEKCVSSNEMVKLITERYKVLHQKYPCDCFSCLQAAAVVCIEDIDLSPSGSEVVKSGTKTRNGDSLQ